MKWFLMLYLFGLTGCATVVNSIPSNDNTEQNSLDSPPMVFGLIVLLLFIKCRMMDISFIPIRLVRTVLLH